MKTAATKPQLGSEHDFRRHLQNELIRRCERNPGYSLRAYARSLNMNHATLSSLLSGKRPLTTKSVINICQALKLSPEKTQSFLRQIDSTSTARRRILEHRELTLDTFITISEWYHDAILELTHTKTFQGNARWIAKALGISVSEAAIAVERLQRLELLEIGRDGKWRDVSRNNTTNISNDFSSAALRKLQKKLLELSAEALETLPRTERDHTSMTIAMQASDLVEVKERIKRFRFELAAFIERKEATPDSVFQLTVSMFPLSKNDAPVSVTSKRRSP